ncbi:MAG TPA: hypothetical protein VMU09_01155 [Acidimicrobiales bacterium]|nr:hypothetical protein [Acidimicrobiales bacterium]
MPDPPEDRTLDPTTPVLIGWGTASRREPGLPNTEEPVALMVEAATAAAPSGAQGAVHSGVDWIGVTQGMTRYADPGRLLGEGIGAPDAHTVLAKIGVMQQTLLSTACEVVRSGEARVALVAGAEARYREVRAGAAGEMAPVTVQGEGVVPDETLEPEADLVLPVEVAAGLTGAPGFYALLDSEWRDRHGRTLEAHREALGRLYARFSEIAAQNPHAVRRTRLDARFLSDPSVDNPMVAFPYTKLMVSTWTVDQASAVVVTTAATATELGVPRARWLFPVVAVESNHIVPVAARSRLTQPAAMGIMADALRERAGIEPAAIDLLDLYSPLPVAVLVAAEGLSVPAQRDVTLTGGMSFAGGPFNSYVFNALVRAAERLARGDATNALVSCVSGLYTKQGLLVLSSAQPSRPFEVVDVTPAVAVAEPPRPVAEEAAGPGRVVAWTVLFAEARPERAVAVIDLADGRRTVACSHDPELMAQAMADDLTGAPVVVADGRFEVRSARSPN